MSVTKYNKGTKFNVNLTGLQFIKMEDVFQMSEDEKAISGKKPVYTITGIFINSKSKFGPRPFVSTPDFLMDLPSYQLETVKQMLADEELIKDVNAGKVGFSVRAYFSNKYKKDCYSVDFEDIIPNVDEPNDSQSESNDTLPF